MRVRGPLLLLLLTAWLWALPAAAQSSGGPIDLQLFRPAIDSKGLITLNASQVLGHLDVSFGLILNYSRRPLSLVGTGGICAAGQDCSRYRINNMVTGNLQAAIGLFKHVELGVGLPLTFWNGDTDPDEVAANTNPDTGDIDAQGAGDLSIHIKGRILNTSKHPVGLALMATLTLPTGADDKFLGDGRVGVTPTVLVDKDFFRGRFQIVANFGARFRFGDKDPWVDQRNCTPLAAAESVPCGTGMTLETTHHVFWGVGFAFGIVPERFDVVAEVVGQFGLNGAFDFDKKHSAQEVLAGFRLYLARNSYLAFGVGRGLRAPGDNYQYGSPDIRGFLGFVFEPSIGDRDGDGIKDDIDKCPTEPEDFDDFEDEDGCPDLDNDKDGILDEDDKCPNEPEDKDGIEDDDGCPEADVLDRDGDGIPDDKDKCPDEPEDKDGFEDEDGCPDPDNDKDGILDVDDLCPNKPEDKDGFEDKDGCPDPDNDKDRILDVDDKCPNEPETYNGYQDEDGCPDKGRVVVHKGRIEILDKIYFETNKAVIKSVSFPILDAIGATLKGNPQITQVEIQGHADERGAADHNMRLTDARAKAVRRYLIDKGVSGDALSGKGYGETRPVDRRHNEAAWSKNRRVEFVIVKRIQ
ncbi:MAG: OmpA family protein [Deltaproteobacteria bacterium]|nr:OmpA family protein [Deltaproteobacteria bacterium]